MDEEGEIALKVEGGKHLKENYVGAHIKNYDSMLMLSHFILSACSRAKNTSNPSISYINGIIEKWKK